MMTLQRQDARKFHQAVSREGLVLSLCDADGDVLGNMTRCDGTPVPDGLGDLSQAQDPETGAWFVAHHTELGRIFLALWEGGEL